MQSLLTRPADGSILETTFPCCILFIPFIDLYLQNYQCIRQGNPGKPIRLMQMTTAKDT